MKWRIQKREVPKSATIELPVSKSYLNRYLLLRKLSGATLPEVRSDMSDDVHILRNLLLSGENELSAKDAGTAMRFATAYFSGLPGERILTGTDRMLQRPIGPLVDGLRQMDAAIDYIGEEGFPPLRIRGKKLKGGKIVVDAGISSQFISAILMIAPYAEGVTTIVLRGQVVSEPYIDMTINLMRQFGAVVHQQSEQITIEPIPYVPADLLIERDWSSASFFYEACALAQNLAITMPGLSRESLQGDRQLAGIYEHLGIKTAFDNTGVTIKKNTPVGQEELTIDFTEAPDLVQPVVMTCVGLGRSLKLTGLHNLHLKETDRLAALAWNVEQLGGSFTYEGITAQLTPGKSTTSKPALRVFKDHRMAMSLAPLAFVHDHIEMPEAEVVSKSFPSFGTALQKCGFEIIEID